LQAWIWIRISISQSHPRLQWIFFFSSFFSLYDEPFNWQFCKKNERIRFWPITDF
jgi:hypothetical protein